MNTPAPTPQVSSMSPFESGLLDKQRNDNSNPQQGTGGARVTCFSPDTYGKPSFTNTYSRPSLKIPPTQKDERKLFVGGLPANVTSEEFRSFFEQFGPVMDSIVLVDKATNRSRGFGFVTFEDVATAKKLLAMGNADGSYTSEPTIGRLEMQGKMIEVKSAQPKEPSRRMHNIPHRYDHASMMQYGPVPHAIPVPAEPAPMSYHPHYDYTYGQPYPAPGAVYAGYVAPMYYCMPGHAEVQAIPDVYSHHHAQSQFMEGYPASAYFVPNAPYTIPAALPQSSVLHPEYPGVASKEETAPASNA